MTQAASVSSILLFYHYERISDVAEEVEWQQQFLSELNVGGRLRIAPAGLNGTLSGRRSSLDQYVAAVTARHSEAWRIDWKFGAAQDDQLFENLTVRAVDEVVSLGVDGQFAPLAEAGQHITPREFHDRLVQASSASQPTASSQIVLLDVRNVYESRIGHFEAPNVDTLLPPTRQFTDLPSYLDTQLEQLRGRTVLMYCTGGVRCESASAYLRHRLLPDDSGDDSGASRAEGLPPAAPPAARPADSATTHILQLSGGIERYMEAFPEGGFFRGVNLVFDRRLVTAPARRAERDVIGCCWVCDAPTDDYSPQRRCRHCRLLLLVCPTCCEIHPQGAPTLTCGECDGCTGGGGAAAARRQKPRRQAKHAREDSRPRATSAPTTGGDPPARPGGGSLPEALHRASDEGQPEASSLPPPSTPPPPPEGALPQRANRRMRRAAAAPMPDAEARSAPSTSETVAVLRSGECGEGSGPGANEGADKGADKGADDDDAADGMASAGHEPGPHAWALRDAPVQYEYLDHTADVQIHSWGQCIEEAFEQQVVGVMGLITELEHVNVPTSPAGEAARREVCVEGHDLPSLLYNFLDEWLFQFNADAFVCKRVKITAFDRARWAIASEGVGETFELGRHPQGIEVKAITYSALRVTEDAERTDVLVIVDI